MISFTTKFSPHRGQNPNRLQPPTATTTDKEEAGIKRLEKSDEMPRTIKQIYYLERGYFWG